MTIEQKNFIIKKLNKLGISEYDTSRIDGNLIIKIENHTDILDEIRTLFSINLISQLKDHVISSTKIKNYTFFPFDNGIIILIIGIKVNIWKQQLRKLKIKNINVNTNTYN